MKGTIIKKYRIIVNITTLYVFIMTFVVSFILSLAQTNDSLVTICKALDMSLVNLLCDEEETEQPIQTDYLLNKKHIIEVFTPSDIETKRRLLRYFELVKICKQINENNASKKNTGEMQNLGSIDMIHALHYQYMMNQGQ